MSLQRIILPLYIVIFHFDFSILHYSPILDPGYPFRMSCQRQIRLRLTLKDSGMDVLRGSTMTTQLRPFRLAYARLLPLKREGDCRVHLLQDLCSYPRSSSYLLLFVPYVLCYYVKMFSAPCFLRNLYSFGISRVGMIICRKDMP